MYANIDFRNDVLLYLHARGVLSADKPEPATGQSLAQRVLTDPGDVVGLPWALVTRANRRLDLSGALAHAESVSENTSKPLSAAIIKRMGRRSIGASYVAMTLDTFLAVVLELHPELVGEAPRG